MPRDNEPAIEVEVLEIDGAAPPPPRDPAAAALAGIDIDDTSPPGHSAANWQRWPGQIRTLPAWWWPLLIIGGTFLLVVMLTLGVLAAALLLVYRMVRGLLRALFE
ncbi:MAG: hypothetical protein DVB26_08660 [Verrucomicrobia bacterium]|nr:MAG: hypothetical protein DVB26_08660 [Verrucomicrobiota bacterium]